MRQLPNGKVNPSISVRCTRVDLIDFGMDEYDGSVVYNYLIGQEGKLTFVDDNAYAVTMPDGGYLFHRDELEEIK